MYAQAGFAIAQVKVQTHEIPSAIGFISMAQIGGSVITLAISNSMFLNQATNGILRVLPTQPRGLIQGAVSGSGSVFFQQLDPNVKRAVLVTITNAIKKTYILGITGAALGVVLSPFMGREKVSKVPFNKIPHLCSSTAAHKQIIASSLTNVSLQLFLAHGVAG